MAVSPVVRRRRLAAELRALRAASGRTLEEVAEYLECSPAKISRLENGQVLARIQDVRDLLDCYQVSGDQREQLLALVRQSRQKGWWYAYSDMISEDLQTYIGLEDEAVQIQTYETHLVPGLLQTDDYSRAIMATRRDIPLDVIDRGMQLRSRRKSLLGRDDPPHVSAILDEAVLRRSVGEADVMRDQCRHLVELARRPTVTLQVLPFTAGAHAGGSHPFTLLTFADPADPRVAYTETLTGRYCINGAEEVGRYISEFDNLRAHAVAAEPTVALLESVLESLVHADRSAS